MSALDRMADALNRKRSHDVISPPMGSGNNLESIASYLGKNNIAAACGCKGSVCTCGGSHSHDHTHSRRRHR